MSRKSTFIHILEILKKLGNRKEMQGTVVELKGKRMASDSMHVAM